MLCASDRDCLYSPSPPPGGCCLWPHRHHWNMAKRLLHTRNTLTRRTTVYSMCWETSGYTPNCRICSSPTSIWDGPLMCPRDALQHQGILIGPCKLTSDPLLHLLLSDSSPVHSDSEGSLQTHLQPSLSISIRRFKIQHQDILALFNTRTFWHSSTPGHFDWQVPLNSHLTLLFIHFYPGHSSTQGHAGSDGSLSTHLWPSSPSTSIWHQNILTQKGPFKLTSDPSSPSTSIKDGFPGHFNTRTFQR